MATASAPAPHVLVVPFPAQGHALPLLDLAAQLASRSIRLTVVTTPANAHLLSPLLATHPDSIQPLVLPFPDHPSLPPGLESVKNCLPSYFAFFIHALAALHWNLESWGDVSNTLRALEGRYLDAPLEHLGSKRVWAVGPLAPETTDATGELGGDLRAWLDGFPEGFIVYVCFGSQAVLTPAVAAALAEALERSAVPFVWAVGGGGEALPDGFEACACASAAKRGLVYGQIRAHAKQRSPPTPLVRVGSQQGASSCRSGAVPVACDIFFSRIQICETHGG